ncbi:unnamed protein product [Darwinula stevensoni]|uniref:TRUD domain-containing protein n=1 Tax=Darwinula stevensoni TaxID=69355 RepID=A0A7R8X6J2_9CRUS|nr:unnamed protein product [Darwinula stevensoni]CAG0885815.1 unnamed protein product [Darwinula stevensoni]
MSKIYQYKPAVKATLYKRMKLIRVVQRQLRGSCLVANSDGSRGEDESIASSGVNMILKTGSQSSHLDHDTLATAVAHSKRHWHKGLSRTVWKEEKQHKLNLEDLGNASTKKLVERFSSPASFPFQRIHSESEVGIGAYVGNHQGFIGAAKHKASDFQVDEIDVEGKVVELTDLTVPEFPDFSKEDIYHGRPWYTHFVIQKCMIDTYSIARALHKELKIPMHVIYSAGLKDRRGITTQRMCVRGHYPQQIVKALGAIKKSFVSVKVGNFSHSPYPLVVGSLSGNNFRITLRDVQAPKGVISRAVDSVVQNGFLNYFGLQRFGSGVIPSNVLGWCILSEKWQTLVDLVMKNELFGDSRDVVKGRRIWLETRDPSKVYQSIEDKHGDIAKMMQHLMLHPGDYENALKCMNHRLLTLWVMGYQSYIWNMIVTRRVHEFGLKPIEGDLVLVDKKAFYRRERLHEGLLAGASTEGLGKREDDIRHLVRPLSRAEASETPIEDVVLPVPGHGVAFPENEISLWYRRLLTRDGFSPEDFHLPWFASRGIYRQLLVKPCDFQWHLVHYNHMYEKLPPKNTPPFSESDPTYHIGGGKDQFQGLLLAFSLPAGCYATELIRELLKQSSGVHNHHSLCVNESVCICDWYRAMPSQQIFFGIYIPPQNVEGKENDNSMGVERVLTNREEALKIAKKHPGARFKAFSVQEDAIHFAQQGFSVRKDAGTAATDNANCEKPLPFKAPKPQDMTRLKKMIEAGEVDTFMQTVWDNPHVQQSGPYTEQLCGCLVPYTPGDKQIKNIWYNALHVGAIAKQAKLCQVLLDTIEDPEFTARLYPDDSPSAHRSRISFLMDLYLNTPDRAGNETPLHFAAKLGAVEVVRILVSYRMCDRERKNKHGETPRDIICSRCSDANPSTKKKIHQLLAEQYFIPLLGSDDTMPLKLLKPWSPDRHGSRPSALPLDQDLLPSGSPHKSQYQVNAYVGPLSSNEADALFKELKQSSSPRSNKRPGAYHDLKARGRAMAREHHVPWKEYWGFLGGFYDLSSDDGLQKLNEHLKNVSRSLTEPRKMVNMKRKRVMQGGSLAEESGSPRLVQVATPFSASLRKDGNVKIPEDSMTLDHSDRISKSARNLALVLTRAALDAHTEMSESLYSPISRESKLPIAMHVKMAQSTAEWIAEDDKMDVVGLLRDLLKRFDQRPNFYMDSSDDDDDDKAQSMLEPVRVGRGGASSWREPQQGKMRTSRLSKDSACILSQIQARLLQEVPLKTCECISNGNRPFQQWNARRLWPVEDKSESVAESEPEDEDVWVTPPSSPEDERPVTPDNSMEFFIHGEVPSRTDVEALAAISYLDSIQLAELYPYVFHWKTVMESLDPNELHRLERTPRRVAFTSSTASIAAPSTSVGFHLKQPLRAASC